MLADVASGACAYRPEHTLASYALAIAMGADYIEPDLVSTGDHVLVARHEPNIADTTDVAAHPEFADRRTTKEIDGIARTGWFAEDFTLAELKTLRARERIPHTRPASTAFDGAFAMPTLQEVVDLARRAGVGIYPETKHPTYFRSIGLALEEPLVRTLERNGLAGRDAPVFLQSFEVANLRALARMVDVPLVQLTSTTGRPYDHVVGGDPRTWADIASPAGLREVARYADAIGPAKAQLVAADGTDAAPRASTLVADAHAAGLLVHPYTYRPENAFLAERLRRGDAADPDYLRAPGDQPAELREAFALGVDGVFVDNPDTAVAVRAEWVRAR